MAAEAYKCTPVFNEESLPGAIRSAHATKEGVWGLLRVLEGEVRLIFHDPRREVRVDPENPAPIPPQALRHVETSGPMRMQVEFYRQPPPGAGE
jgi:tellurite resistance-related uncharacterized protein